MSFSHRLLEKFWKLSVFRQSSLIVLVAVIGAETLTLVFYSIFFADRLILDMVFTAVIVIVIGFPIAYFFFGQQVKLADMAAKLNHAASTDGLTGLANRETFFKQATAVMAQGKPLPDALLFIDVDHFKSVNDTFGHPTGDAMLRELALVIRSSIRAKDIAARLGGEEFAIFLVDTDRAEAMQVAERIRVNVRNITCISDIGNCGITVSVGVGVREPSDSLEDLLLKADRNLYAAKGRGRDLVVDDHPCPPVPVRAVSPGIRAGAA